MNEPDGGAPFVPRSQEEIDQELEDARLDEEEAQRASRERALKGAWRLLGLAAGCAVMAVVASYLLAPRPFAHGMAVGSAVMLLNLWGLKVLLARIIYGDPRRGALTILLVGKFILLVAASGLFVRTFPESAMGFGLGLSIPAMAGILWSAVGRRISG